MRGKTNATNGVHLNATAVNKTVKSGQINAGDFVEYFTEPTYIVQSNDVIFQFCVGDYAIAIISGFLAAFKDGEQVNTFTGMTCSYVALVDNFIVVLDNSHGAIGVLSISSNGFTLIDTISTISTGFGCIGGGNGKIALVKRVSSSEILVGAVNISSSGELSTYQETSLSENIGSGFCLIGYYNEKIYVVTNGGSYELIIASDNSVTIGSFVQNTVTSYSKWKEIYRAGSIIVIAFYMGSSYHRGCLVIIDFVGGSNSVLGLGWEIVTCINDGFFLATSKVYYSSSSYRPVWYNGSGLYITNALILYHFDEETYAISEVDRIEYSRDYYTQMQSTEPGAVIYYNMFKDEKCGEGMIQGSTIYAQIKKQVEVTVSNYANVERYQYISSQNIDLYEILDETELQEMSQKDYVIPYAAGHPIGVAKTDGVTNDIIPVYIPTASP